MSVSRSGKAASRSVKGLGVVIGMAVALAAVVGVARGDNVQSDVGTTTGITTITSGDSTEITYTLVGNAAQGDVQGCNATAANPVTVTINRPTGVTGSPSTLSFTACGVAQTATFSSATPGDPYITHDFSGGRSGSLFKNQANFTLHVNAPAPPTNTPPSLSLSADKTVEASGPEGAAVSYDVSAFDHEDGPLQASCSRAAGSIFALGLTQVNCSVTDSRGLSATGMFNVTVVDTIAPALALPDDKIVEATGANGAAILFSATASDLVDGDDVEVACGPSSGDSFALGTTTVNCTATDAHDNSASGSFKITVEDTTAPTLDLPEDMTREATGPAGAAVSFSATASDLVDGDDVEVACGPSSGDSFALGTTTVNCTATDAHDNSASGSFKITVEDTTAPTLDLPEDMTREATGPAGAAVSFSATASDLVDGDDVEVACGPSSGDSFALGTTTVNCTATDAHDNSASGSFKITVEDTTAPTLDLPEDMTREATGPAGAAVSFSATASDLVDGDDVEVACGPSSGDSFALGTTTVNCTATDAHDNSASGSFKITVEDTTAPTLDLPEDMTREATGPAGAAVSFSATASDLVDGDDVEAACGPSSGDSFALGTTTVNCTATDAHDNSASGSFKITVEDTTAPTLDLPADVNVSASSNSRATVNYSVSASDLVDGPVAVSCDRASGSGFPGRHDNRDLLGNRYARQQSDRQL